MAPSTVSLEIWGYCCLWVLAISVILEYTDVGSWWISDLDEEVILISVGLFTALVEGDICGLVLCVIGSVLVVALKGSSTPVLLHRSEIVKAASLISEEGCKITWENYILTQMMAS